MKITEAHAREIFKAFTTRVDEGYPISEDMLQFLKELQEHQPGAYTLIEWQLLEECHESNVKHKVQHALTYPGDTLTVDELAEKLNVSAARIRAHLDLHRS